MQNLRKLYVSKKFEIPFVSYFRNLRYNETYQNACKESLLTRVTRVKMIHRHFYADTLLLTKKRLEMFHSSCRRCDLQ